MDKIPPRYAFILVWGALLCYLTFNFISRASISFIQFNFDWDQIEILDTIEKIKIDSISNDYLSIQKDFPIPKTLNKRNTFLVDDGKKIFFRTTAIIKDSNHIIFSGVKWINRIPKRNDEIAGLNIIDLPLIQPNGKSTMTLGDSQIIWRDARELRKNLAEKRNFYFVGSKSDVYGYPFEGDTFDKITDLIAKIKNAEPAENYLLFFGAQDKALDEIQLENNICELLMLLQNKSKTERIFLITLPPSTNVEFDEYNKNFNKYLIQFARQSKKIKIIDLHKFLKDKTDYLADDEVHLNEKGYLFLNKLLLKEIH